MKKIGLSLVVLAIFGCAKVSVETKDPIKVDIKMRIDVYQHVAQDVESINDQIYGGKEQKFNAIFNIGIAYADDLSPQVQAAISRRKERASKVAEYFQKGYIGENRRALLEVRSADSADANDLVNQENKDRKAIYSAIADKNNTDVSETEKVFFQDDYRRAPSGYWFEVNVAGEYLWKKK